MGRPLNNQYKMYKIDKVFFSNEGVSLSSTSANHIANLAKEFVKGNYRDLEGMHFVEKCVGVLGLQAAQSILQKGAGQQELDSVTQKLTEIGEANSLIAWLREGIKAKNEYLEKAKNLTKALYCEWEGVDPASVEFKCPELSDFLRENGFTSEPVRPLRRPKLTESQVLESWVEGDRLDFLTTKEAYQAISTAISSLGETLNKLSDVQDSPVTTGSVGDKVFLYQSHPNINLDAVNKTLEVLVAKRQGLSNSLREYRQRIAETIRKEGDKSEAEYQEKKSSYQKEIAEYNRLLQRYERVVMAEVENKREEFETMLENYRVNKAKEVGNLKIVVPSSLMGIYSKVSALGKQ